MPALIRTLAASAVLLLAGVATFYAATDRFEAFTTESARRLAVRRHPVAVPPVTLQTQSGERLDLAALRGRWLLVDFIYTRCPTLCIAAGSEFAQLERRLGDEIARGEVQLVSISFDPDRDTPDALAAWLRRSRGQGDGWIAARPVGPGALPALERAFGITVVADGTGGFTHNAAIHVVDPEGRLVDILDLGEGERAARIVLAGLDR